MGAYKREQHRRRSIRLRNYDYRQPGAYFVTIVLQNRRRLFGFIVDRQFHANAAGAMVAACWLRLPDQFPTVLPGTFVVMPDHMHGIIFINPVKTNNTPIADVPAQNSVTLGAIVQWFKATTTNAYIRGVRDQGWPAFDRRLWQRNYYEHIIRNTAELQRIQTYIESNPARWIDKPDNSQE